MSFPYRDPSPGSTGHLVGKIFPLIFWVSPRGAHWPSADKKTADQHIRSAHLWLERQAKVWGSRLSILPGRQFGRDRDIQLQFVPGGYDSDDAALNWMRALTGACGLGTPGQLYDRIRRDYPSCDSVHATVMVHRTGRSYAMVSPEDPCADTMLAAAINFVSPASGTISWRTLAHETLHLYGAEDLYPTEIISREQARHARRVFPRDIMGECPEHADPAVQALTAWRIGWNSAAESWFDFFEPRPVDRAREAWEPTPSPPPHAMSLWIARLRRFFR